MNNNNANKVVTFKNGTDFEFTPELGAMYDSQPIFGGSGQPLQAGESIILPYAIGNLMARNLAKVVLTRSAKVDKAGIPTGEPVWSAESLEKVKASFLTEMYTEAKEKTLSETEIMMAKVEKYNATVEALIPDIKENTVESKFSDKADVIKELEKREIKFNARLSKSALEELLA